MEGCCALWGRQGGGDGGGQQSGGVRMIFGGVDHGGWAALRQLLQEPIGQDGCCAFGAAGGVDCDVGQCGGQLGSVCHGFDQTSPVGGNGGHIEFDRADGEGTDGVGVPDIDGKVACLAHGGDHIWQHLGDDQSGKGACQSCFSQKEARLDRAKAESDKRAHQRISCPPVTLMAWPVM